MHNNYTTILIGNGLGMAVDDVYFKLNTALNASYQKLTPNEKDIILSIEERVIKKNNVEERFKNHYKIIKAIILLEEFERKTKKT